MTFEDVVRELSRLQGRLVLVQFRPVGSSKNIAELLDGVDRVDDGADTTYVAFSEAEASVMVRRAEFVEAAWERGWRPGEEDERLLRIRLGSVDVGFILA
jgi:hypothetical protein